LRTGESELARDEMSNGGTTVFAEDGGACAPEVVQDARDEVVGGGAAVSGDEANERATGPRETEPVAVKEKGALTREPLHGEQVERIAEPAEGIGEMGFTRFACVVLLAAEMGIDFARGIARRAT
jgi:hypothetical protein